MDAHLGAYCDISSEGTLNYVTVGNHPVRHGVMFAIVPMLPKWGFNFLLA